MPSNDSAISGTEDRHWQVVEVTGVGIGELWFDVVQEELDRETAESKASMAERRVAVPMPYSPEEPVGIGEVTDDYRREVVEQ